MSVGEDMCNFASFRPATLTVTNFFKQVHLFPVVMLMIQLIVNTVKVILDNYFAFSVYVWGLCSCLTMLLCKTGKVIFQILSLHTIDYLLKINYFSARAFLDHKLNYVFERHKKVISNNNKRKQN